MKSIQILRNSTNPNSNSPKSLYLISDKANKNGHLENHLMRSMMITIWDLIKARPTSMKVGRTFKRE
jgi:hypothetical protein